MRNFEQLDGEEKFDALEHCYAEVLELLYDGIIVAQGEVNEKINQALEESEDFAAFSVHPIILEDCKVLGSVEDWAEAMAMDAEYPSRNEDGSYKKVIQF